MPASEDQRSSTHTELPLLDEGPLAARGTPVSIEDSGVLVVRSQAGMQSLEDFLLGERAAPVVVLSQSTDTFQPVLSPGRIRTIIGPEGAIYYVPGEQLLRQLRAVLGHALALSRGAVRIFWPGLTIRSDPADHPLVPMLDGESEEDALAEFARQFDLSRPRVRSEIKLIEDSRSLLQGELDAVRQEAHHVAEQLRDANIDRHEAVTRAERAEEYQGDEAQTSAMNCEEVLHALISREWLRAFLPADRREYPLGAHVLTPGFIAALEERTELSYDRVAWVCAMVACGYAPSLPGTAPQPLLTRGGAQLRREDGAKGWRCNLKGDAAHAPYVHFWVRLDQAVEFAGIGLHEESRAR
jgi:hypothetical protein